MIDIFSLSVEEMASKITGKEGLFFEGPAKVFNSELFLENSIQAPSINELFLKKSLKKDLWLKIKSKLNL